MPVISLSRNSEAVIWVTLGTAAFSIVYASGKFAGHTAHPLQIMFLRYVGGFISLFLIAALTGQKSTSYVSTKPFSHFIRAVLGCYGGVAIVYASANMPIIDATAISLLYVIMVIPLGVVFFNERISHVHWFAIGVSTLGAALIMLSRGAFQNFDTSYLLPALVALGGATFIAFEGIMIKTLSQMDKAFTVLLHVNFFGVILVAVPAVLAWQSTVFLDNLPFLFLGPVAITAQYFIIRGYRMADISIVGPVDYTWLVFAALIGYGLFDEVPTLEVIGGACLIAFGGVILVALKSE